MGMPRWAVLAAWAVVYGVILGALAVIMTVICCASFLSATQWSLVLAVFLAFAFSQLGFGVLVSQNLSLLRFDFFHADGRRLYRILSLVMHCTHAGLELYLER